jgi:hypothetical protein
MIKTSGIAVRMIILEKPEKATLSGCKRPSVPAALN